jgi:dethiobiotin synthetase
VKYFVTGTDTDCGKTYVTALLVRAARTAGIDAIAAKPFCCGPRTDVEILFEASERLVTMEEMNPVWMKTPVAPRAAEMLGEPAGDVAAALAAMRILSERHEGFFCEGAGGWMVPVARGYTTADFAVALGWPVIVVVRNKLGALSHTLLTLESVRSRGLKVAGVILNDVDGANDEATRTNRDILLETIQAPLLAEVPPAAEKIAWPTILDSRR